MSDISQPPGVITDVPDGSALIDYQQNAAIIGLQEQVVQLLAEAEALKDAVQQNTADIAELASRTSAAISDLACPNGMFINMPADGWTGRPEDAPGATPANIGECVAEGYCNCAAGLALSPGWTPADES